MFKHKHKSRLHHAHRLFWLTMLVGCCLIVLPILVLYVYAFSVPIPRNVTLSSNSIVVDEYGNQIGQLSRSSSQLIESNHLPNNLVRAVLAAEDHNYYQHSAVSWISLIGATIANLSPGGVTRGGSTITQQYVKNTYVSTNSQIFERKIREAAIGIKLENVLIQQLGSKQAAKDEILASYLNTIYFGHGLIGADAAAHFYFNKPPDQLSEVEAATLAGIIRAPSLYQSRVLNLPSEGSLDTASDQAAADPQHRYDMILRRNQVLSAMNDAHWLANPDALLALERSNLNLASSPDATATEASSICLLEKARGVVQAQLGTSALTMPGLKVQLTIDSSLQAAARTAANHGRPSPDALVGLVALDPQTGAVRSVYDNCDLNHQYNIAIDAQRQIASTIKPIALATALRTNLTLPTYAFVPGCLTRAGYTICNDDKLDRTNLSAETAIAQSNNPYFVLLSTTLLGLNNLYDGFSQQGVSTGDIPATPATNCPLVPALAIGACERSVLAMASAYSTWSNRGIHADPYLVTQITNATGTVLYRHAVQAQIALSPTQADEMNQFLSGVINRPDGTAHATAQLTRPAAGKTGTSSDNADGWFIGYVPAAEPGSHKASKTLATAVWVGYDDHHSLQTSGTDGAGAGVAAPIWRDFMTSALNGQPARQFVTP